MNYKETVEYLYNATPQFQRIGAAAYKPGLDTAHRLDDAFGNPHREYHTIHVAGTNGKGSTCHTLASILQHQGYRVGLFTSPHLVDFRERIRVDGEMISEEAVVDFVKRYLAMKGDGDNGASEGCDSLGGVEPSFFELTTMMAFDYFRKCGVDVAVIETGLGGRLDTTNIISPVVSVITNISRDHMAQLGDTLAQIAGEKAGIIKHGVPVVIGNASGEGVRDVFERSAGEVGAPIFFACDEKMYGAVEHTPEYNIYRGTCVGDLKGELTGDCQPENAATVLKVVDVLRDRSLAAVDLEISDDAIRKGFAEVCETTGLAGRWMKLADMPLTLCDTGHNEGGWQYLAPRLDSYGTRLKMVIGFVNDKDVSHILSMMPREAEYYFTRASVPRAMDVHVLAELAHASGLKGECYESVAEAWAAAKKNADEDSVIFIGGSTFVVADALSAIRDM